MKIRKYSGALMLLALCATASAHDGPRNGFLITTDDPNFKQLGQSMMHSFQMGKPVEDKFGFKWQWSMVPTLEHEPGKRFIFLTGEESAIKAWIKSTGAKVLGFQTATVQGQSQ